jgi:transcriptional regulator of aromatic amino acid metabolism
VGGIQEIHADVRIIAATNKLLEDEQKAGRFREDLFYPLNVVCISLPHLQERLQDIPELVRHFLTSRPIGSQPFQISPELLDVFAAYDWPVTLTPSHCAMWSAATYRRYCAKEKAARSMPRASWELVAARFIV